MAASSDRPCGQTPYTRRPESRRCPRPSRGSAMSRPQAPAAIRHRPQRRPQPMSPAGRWLVAALALAWLVGGAGLAWWLAQRPRSGRRTPHRRKPTPPEAPAQDDRRTASSAWPRCAAPTRSAATPTATCRATLAESDEQIAEPARRRRLLRTLRRRERRAPGPDRAFGRIRAAKPAAAWRYQVVLTQSLNRGAVSQGECASTVEGVRDGKLATVKWDEMQQKPAAPGQRLRVPLFPAARAAASCCPPGSPRSASGWRCAARARTSTRRSRGR